MIEHVYTRVARARGLNRVVVLTDDERIARAVEGMMTESLGPRLYAKLMDHAHKRRG